MQSKFIYLVCLVNATGDSMPVVAYHSHAEAVSRADSMVTSRVDESGYPLATPAEMCCCYAIVKGVEVLDAPVL